MKFWPVILFLCLSLFGCSDSTSDISSSPPDHIRKEGNSVISNKIIGNYQLQLAVEKKNENTFLFRPSIKYVGDKNDSEIFHANKFLTIDIQTHGVTILPPRATTTEGITTILTKEQWHTEEYEITLTDSQIKELSKSEGHVILSAIFESDETSFEEAKEMIFSTKEIIDI
ncbi:hypothetical protein [Paenibacillus sp. 453mf]|uniref:hypothetical protein n=1 Tax=Paenibacillus sp. 453mf TaxID=1761874 RepID=UPI0008DFE91E|nr:hypothetical protein [Paenibacillus sp. 453mf]SFS77781.1 hypothetical protein SAMN04488601_103187 [Paenibacillus sp. 453mf]